MRNNLASPLKMIFKFEFQHDHWFMRANLENWTYIDSRDPNNVKVLTEIHDPWIENQF